MGWQESEAGNGENGEGETGHKPSNEVKVGLSPSHDCALRC
jgi:hypothetical protein